MNENKHEIIYISEDMAYRIAAGRQSFEQTSISVKPYMKNDVGYILKSKYDELLDRLGKVECYVIDLRREKDELSLENARLTADLAKVEAELKECKEGFTKQIDEFYELRKVTIDTINQRNELLIENTKLKAELERVRAENDILSTPISQEPLIAKDVPCTCDWQKVYPHLSVLCNPSSCKKQNKPIKTPEKK